MPGDSLPVHGYHDDSATDITAEGKTVIFHRESREAGYSVIP